MVCVATSLWKFGTADMSFIPCFGVKREDALMMTISSETYFFGDISIYCVQDHTDQLKKPRVRVEPVCVAERGIDKGVQPMGLTFVRGAVHEVVCGNRGTNS